MIESTTKGTVGLLTQSTNGITKMGFNFSLIKGTTIIQGLIGLFITTSVIVSTMTGIGVITIMSTIKKPIIKDDDIKMMKNEKIDIFPLLNDISNTNNGIITIEDVIKPKYGEIKVIDKMKIQYKPNKYYSGKDIIRYMIKNDKIEAQEYGNINIEIINNPPITTDIIANVRKFTTTYIEFPINKEIDGVKIKDIDGDIIEIKNITQCKYGEIEFDENRRGIYYRSIYEGEKEELIYTITDYNDTTQGKLYINIVNTGPIAVNDVYELDRNNQHILDVLENDYDINKDNITIRDIDKKGVIGNVFIHDDKILYIPDVKIHNTISFLFNYMISDGKTTSVGIVTIKLINNKPIAYDIYEKVGKNKQIEISSFNYTDEDKYTTLKLDIHEPNIGKWTNKDISQPILKKGISFNDIQMEYYEYKYKYTYKANKYEYREKIKYIVVDQGGEKGEANIIIDVINEAPKTKQKQVQCDKNTQIEIKLINCNESEKWDICDENGDNIYIYNVSKGEIRQNKIKYKCPNRIGEDEIQYIIKDEDKNTPMQAINKIKIKIKNSPPIANDDEYPNDNIRDIYKNETIILYDILNNDYDINNDTLFINDIIIENDIKYRYIPKIDKDKKKIILNTQGLNHGKYNIKYRVNDNITTSEYANINIYIKNRQPQAKNITIIQHYRKYIINRYINNEYSTIYKNMEIDITKYISDKDGDKIELQKLKNNITENGNKIWKKENENIIILEFKNRDTQKEEIEYVIQDNDENNKLQDKAYIKIQLTNGYIDTIDKNYTTHWNRNLTITKDELIRGNVHSRNDELYFYNISKYTDKLKITELNDKIIIYNTNNFNGNDNFEYIITDSRIYKTVKVDISTYNIKPIAPEIKIKTHWNKQIRKKIIGNDYIISPGSIYNKDNDPTKIININKIKDKYGNISIHNYNEIIYTPSGSYLGEIKINYTISDNIDTHTNNIILITTNNDIPKNNDIIKKLHWRDIKEKGTEILIYNSIKDNDGDDVNIKIDNNENMLTNITNKNNKQYIIIKSKLYPINKQDIIYKYNLTDIISESNNKIIIKLENNKPKCEDKYIIKHWDELNNYYVIDNINFYDLDTQDNDHLVIKIISNSNISEYYTVQPHNKTIKYKTNNKIQQDEIKYIVYDGLEQSDICKINIKITNTETSIRSITYEKHWQIYKNGDILSILNNNTDIDGDKIRLTNVDHNQYGSQINIINDTHIFYKPINKNIKIDYIKINYTDGISVSYINVYINIINQIPISENININKHWTLLENSINIHVLNYTYDKDDNDIVSLYNYTNPKYGIINKINNTILNYKLDINKIENNILDIYDEFIYTITDGRDKNSNNIKINIINGIPNTNIKNYNIHWKKRINGIILNITENDNTGNYLDDKNENLKLISFCCLSDNDAGVISIYDNSILYIKDDKVYNYVNKNFNFKYLISDGLNQVEGLVNIHVFNNKPICHDKFIDIHWRYVIDDFIYINLTNYINDIDIYDNITILNFNSDQNSHIIKINDTHIKYKALHKYKNDVIYYNVYDGIENSNLCKIYISLTNQPFTYNLKNNKVKWNNEININMNINDPFNDTLYYKILSTPKKGNIFISDINNITYIPISNLYTSEIDHYNEYNDTFIISIYDDFGYNKEITNKITVYNHKPKIKDIYIYTKRNTSNYILSNKFIKINIIDNYIGTDNNINYNRVYYFNNSVSDFDNDGVYIYNAEIIYTHPHLDNNNKGILRYDNNNIYYNQNNINYTGYELIKFYVSDGNLFNYHIINFTTLNDNFYCDNVHLGQFNKSDLINKKFNIDIFNCFDNNGDVLYYSILNYTTGNLGKYELIDNHIIYNVNRNRSGYEQIFISVTDNHFYKNFSLSFYIINLPILNITDNSLIFNYSDPITIKFDVLQFLYDNDNETIMLSHYHDFSNCLNDSHIGGDLFYDSNYIHFTPNFNIFNHSCIFIFYVIDSDIDNPSISPITYNITLINSPPVAVNDTIYIKQSQQSYIIYGSSLINNDYDINNNNIKFHEFICDDNICFNPIDNFGNYIVYYPNNNNCNKDYIKYSIKSDDGLSSYAFINIVITDCICKIPIDVVFVLDGSGSISSSQWTQGLNFIHNIVNRFEIGNDMVHFGIVQYSTSNYALYDSNYGFDLTYDINKINKITQLRQLGGATNTIAGLRTAVDILIRHNRHNVPKVIVIVTDGIANRPCNCGQCRSLYKYWLPGNTNDFYEFKCQRNISELSFGAEQFHSLSCNECVYSNSKQQFCEPCSDPKRFADLVNNNKVFGSDHPPDNNNWKIVAIAADGGIPDRGYQQVRSMNYDSDNALKIKWDELDNIYRIIADQTCNQT